MNNILVTGSKGQLGSEIRAFSENYPNDNFFFTDVEELDICNHEVVANFIKFNNINTIINCAAYTAVDNAEEQTELVNSINHLAVTNFAQIAKDNNIKFVHISTDYVFDGMSYKPYVETDSPNPQSVYGITKLAGEKSIQQINPTNSIIIRTSWGYSNFGNNFVKTMLRLGKERDQLNIVADQIGTPTNDADLAKAILTILPKLENDNVELYHFSNEGVCSWYDFTKAIFEIINMNCRFNPIPTSQFPTAAQRPHFSLLNKSKIKEIFHLEVPYWRDSLMICIQKLNSHKN